MRKNDISGVISYNNFKFVDLFLFMVIMAVLEAVNVFAVKQWFDKMYFSVSLMFTVSLIVFVRWNLWGAIFPVTHGVLYCAFLCAFGGVDPSSFVIYSIGNAFIIPVWFIFKIIPKEKLFSKWYLTLIYPAAAFVLVLLGRSAVAACFGNNFLQALGETLFTESLNITFAVVALLILRRVNGMLVDQKKYLISIARERDDARIPQDDVWRGYTELDEEELKKLHGGSGEEKKQEGDGISMWDEYPPDSR